MIFILHQVIEDQDKQPCTRSRELLEGTGKEIFVLLSYKTTDRSRQPLPKAKNLVRKEKDLLFYLELLNKQRQQCTRYL